MEITALISSIIAVLLGVVAAALSYWVGYWSEARKSKREAPTLEDRITTLTENLRSSSSVISEIEAEIDKRRQIADRLRNDVQRYEQLRELNQSQVEAIAQTIRSEIAGESRKSIWRNALITFVVALAFFFLGFWIRGA